MKDDQDKRPQHPPYAVAGGPVGLPLKPVDYDEAQSNEELPTGVAGGSYAGHCVVGSSSVGAEDQNKINQKGI